MGEFPVGQLSTQQAGPVATTSGAPMLPKLTPIQAPWAEEVAGGQHTCLRLAQSSWMLEPERPLKVVHCTGMKTEA